MDVAVYMDSLARFWQFTRISFMYERCLVNGLRVVIIGRRWHVNILCSSGGALIFFAPITPNLNIPTVGVAYMHKHALSLAVENVGGAYIFNIASHWSQRCITDRSRARHPATPHAAQRHLLLIRADTGVVDRAAARTSVTHGACGAAVD